MTKANKSSDPLRAELAARAAAAKEARDALARQRAAIQRLRNRVDGELRKSVEAAEAGVERARAAHAAALAKAAVDGKKVQVPQSSVKAARIALEDARDELEAQKAALARLEDELSEFQHVARERTIAAEREISALLARHLEAMVERAEEMLAPFWPLRRALLDVVQASIMTAGADALAHQRSMDPFDEALPAINAVLGPLTKREPPTEPARNYWRVMREKLRADPYAELLLPDVAGVDTTDAVDAADAA